MSGGESRGVVISPSWNRASSRRVDLSVGPVLVDRCQVPSVKPSPTLLFAVAVLVVLVVLAAPIPAPAVQVLAV
jgi:hypothetical protein